MTEALATVDALPDAPNERPRGGWRGALVVLFAVYLALLVWVVLWKLHVPFIGRDDMREIKVIPFAATVGYGASAPFEVIANMAIFVPFGVYLGLLAPKWPWWKVVGVVAGASLVLEIAQYATAVGSSDVTDVIVNTAGGLVGFGLLAIARRRLRSRTVVTMTWILGVGTVLALVVAGAMIASFPQLQPPNDMGGGDLQIQSR